MDFHPVMLAVQHLQTFLAVLNVVCPPRKSHHCGRVETISRMFFLMKILHYKFQIVCDALQIQSSSDQNSVVVSVVNLDYLF